MPGAERDTALDRALDELYAATPPEFILVRSRLEKELRRADDAEAAAEVRGRRRPNLAAWATNQLARLDPDGIAELLTLTRRLTDEQQAVVDGRSPDVWRDVARHRRDLLDALAAGAVRALQPWAPKPATYRDAIAATLDAASLDPASVTDLEEGRLARPLTVPAGLGPVPDPNAPRASTAVVSRGPSKREVDAAQRELTASQREAAELAAAAETAATEQASAEMEADATATQLREVERAVDRARAAARHAAQEAQAARARTKGARQVADRAEQRARRAEQAVRDLEGR